tara:strand:+ start:54 stop:212 length:159 start_codon:yes stop_codon:yes gene_type:complete
VIDLPMQSKTNIAEKKKRERELKLKQQMRNNLLKRKEQKRMKKTLNDKKNQK